MSAVTTAAPTHAPVSAGAGLPAPARAPLARLGRVELRKLVDTRSGLWLLIATVLVTAVAVLLVAIVGDRGDRDLATLLSVTLLPVGVLLPIVAILGTTSEFSQRTALQTFTAIPQRGRVVQAKAVAVLALGVIALLACVLLAAVVNVVAPAFADADGSWSIPIADLGGALLWTELSLLIGLAFGMLFASPAVAIVVYFVLPTAFSALASLIGFLRDARPWIDTSVAWQPLTEGGAHGQDWAQIATSSALWVALPVVVGLWLLRRREVS